MILDFRLLKGACTAWQAVLLTVRDCADAVRERAVLAGERHLAAGKAPGPHQPTTRKGADSAVLAAELAAVALALAAVVHEAVVALAAVVHEAAVALAAVVYEAVVALAVVLAAVALPVQPGKPRGSPPTLVTQTEAVQ